MSLGGSSKPQTTTQVVEPWSGAKPYLQEYYAKADELFESGAPKQWEGKNIADQSQATKDALAGIENLARNGNTSTLTNATNAVNSVMNSNGNAQANDTLSQLQNGTNLGTNPTNSIASAIANGQTAQQPGQYNQNYTNSAINAINGMTNATNPALASASQFGNYSNGAVGQAQNMSGYQNAALGMQQQQANSLATSSNPSLAYLQNTASGANIGNNPYLNQMVSQQQDKIAEKLASVTNPALASQAASLGRMGSGAFASQLNNAQGAAANEMAKVATDMFGNQYNQDVANQMAAAGQYGNFANQDVANRLNANQALAQTSDSQQQQRLAGTQLYGNLNDSQNQQRLAGTELYGNLASQQQQNQLNAANSLGQMNDSQEAQRLAASNSANQQFNTNNQYQMQGLEMLGNNYQNSIANMLQSNDQRLNAANSQINGKR